MHRAVSDLTGETGIRIVRVIVAGERDPRKLVALWHKRCDKSEAEFVAYPTGTWRDELLFNLQAVLRLYDTVQESVADYERQLLEALWPEERRAEPVPPRPNPKKERVMRSKGQLDQREARWRVTGVDLPRIDTGAARAILAEAFPDLSGISRAGCGWRRARRCPGAIRCAAKRTVRARRGSPPRYAWRRSRSSTPTRRWGLPSGARRAARASQWRCSPSRKLAHLACRA